MPLTAFEFIYIVVTLQQSCSEFGTQQALIHKGED